MPPEAEDEAVRVAELFADVARSLAPGDPQAKLEKIVSLAVEQLDACEFASISLVEGKGITSPASSNDIPRVVDAIRSEVGEGPCVDAIKERQLFQTGDLTAEARREDQLERKADSRDLIGRAKGILMARSNVDDERAFDMLRRASQRLNIKLVEVAERVAHPGDAGGPPPEPSL